MELSKKERLSLINQFLILEKLYPDEAIYYEQHRIALQQGFQLHYKWILEHVWDDLPEEECRKVLDALDLYRGILSSFDALKEKDGISESKVRFPGFDGNNESHYLAYARYFIVDLERYEELIRDQEYPDFNSHCPMLETYGRMTSMWQSWQSPHNMSAAQIRTLLEA
ncbi:MAG: YfbU family protein [Variovorax sp.]|nr:MAG: YfbU family protein [Variovorax sp.]